MPTSHFGRLFSQALELQTSAVGQLYAADWLFYLQYHLQIPDLQAEKDSVLKEQSFSAPPPPDPAQTTSCSTGVRRRWGYGGVCDGDWLK